MFTGLMRLLLLVAGLTALTCASPEAEADPAAQPQPEPEADPQMPGAWLNQNNQVNVGMPSYGSSYGQPSAPGAYPDPNGNIIDTGLGPNNWGGQGSSWGGQGHSHGDSCGAVDQCCNMSNENCCLENRQKCYVVYKRKCSGPGDASCRRGNAVKMEPYILKTCRQIQGPVRLTVPDMVCKKTYGEREIKYNVTTCKRYPVPVDDDITVTNESVEEDQDRRCIPTKKCNIVERQVEKITYTKKKECKQVPFQRNECRMITVDRPPVKQVQVIYSQVLVTVCKKIPKTVCSPSGCGQQGCSNPTYPNVCSTNNMQTENICSTCQSPVPLGGQCSNNCIQVQTPTCGTGSCQRGPQICCRTEYQKVCKPERQKIARTVQISVPQPPITKQDCQPVTDYKDQCTWVQVPNTYNVTVKNCNLIDDQHCFVIPKYTKLYNTTSVRVEGSGSRCEYETKEESKTVTYPTGEQCQEVEKSVTKMVTKTVCDRQFTKYKRITYPVEQCQPGVTPTCTNVPEVVCQDTCSQSQQCNYCSEQYSTGALSQCPTSTCPNFMGGSIPYTT